MAYGICLYYKFYEIRILQFAATQHCIQNIIVAVCTRLLVVILESGSAKNETKSIFNIVLEYRTVHVSIYV